MNLTKLCLGMSITCTIAAALVGTDPVHAVEDDVIKPIAIQQNRNDLLADTTELINQDDLLDFSAIEGDLAAEEVIIPYDEEAYNLAFTTFLGNRDVNNAFLVAQTAVQQRPSDIIWRRRLAQTASWNSKPRVALRQWIWLSENEKTLRKRKEARDKAENIAKAVNDHETVLRILKEKIKENPKNTKVIKDIGIVYEKLGEPELALEYLQKENKKHKNKQLAEEIIRIQTNLGDFENEEASVKEYTKLYGMSPKLAMRQAEIHYNQGKIAQALDELNLAKAQASVKDLDYWEALGNLAWTLQDKKSSLYAYQMMYKSGESDPEELRRLVVLTREIDPVLAHKLAVEGWKKHKTDAFLLTYIDLSVQLQKWEVLKKIYANLSPEEKKRFENNAFFLSTKAQMYSNLGEFDKADAVFQKIIRTHPENMTVKRDYIWFLLAQEDKDKILTNLRSLQDVISTSPVLWQAAASSYSYLGLNEQAYKLYQRMVEENPDDYRLLIEAADLLERSSRTEQARVVRHRALIALSRAIQKNIKGISEEDLAIYMRLAIAETPGDFAHQMMTLTCERSEDIDEVLLTWAIGRNNLEMQEIIDYCRYRDADTYHIPYFAAVNIALPKYDIDTLEKTLRDHYKDVPIRDRAIAAEVAQDLSLAQEFAYHGLENSPDDKLMYDIFERQMLLSANKSDSRFEERTFSLVKGNQTRQSITYFIDVNNFVRPYYNYWDNDSTDKTELARTFSPDQQAGIVYGHKTTRSETHFDLGYHNAMDENVMVRVFNRYLLHRQLTSLININYQRPSEETTPLLIGGNQSGASVALQYSITERDVVTAGVEQQFFNTQDGEYLGQGQTYRIRYDHIFLFEFPDSLNPDLAAALYVSAHKYTREDVESINSRITEIVPAGNVPGDDFYVPFNFRQYGASVYFGQRYVDNYTHALRPFGEASVFWDTETGRGYFFNFGLATSVLGRDHLSAYIQQGSNLNDAGQINRVAGLRYQYYLY